MATHGAEMLDRLSSLFKQVLTDASAVSVDNYVPDDFVRVTLEAIERLHQENAPNLLYLFAKALSAEDTDSQLPVESMAFKLIHLMLLSVVEKRMEILELCSMEFQEELDIVEWNKESFLPGLNEILFPSRSVRFKIAPRGLRSEQAFVLQKTFDEEDHEESMEEDTQDPHESDDSATKDDGSSKDESGAVDDVVPTIEPYNTSDFEADDVIVDETIPQNKQETPDAKNEILFNRKDLVTMYKCLQCPFVVKIPEEMSKHVRKVHSGGGESTSTPQDMDTEPTPNETEIPKPVTQIKTEATELPRKPRKQKYKGLKLNPASTCSMCMRQFPTVDEKEEHEAQAACLSCFDCDATYKTKDEWTKHHRTMHGKKQALCPFCNKEYRSCHLQRHIECVHYKIRKHECGKCGRGFFEKKDRVKHELTCQLKSQDCSICSETLKNCSQLRKHLKNVHNLFPCTHCDDHFEDSAALRNHVIEKHEDSKDVAEKVCEQCGKLCQGMTNLKSHIRTAHRMKPEVISFCQLCKKSFRSQYYLKQHIASVHEKKRDFSCEVCKKGFSSSAHLQEHVGVHDNIKRYTCDTCGEGFVHRASFKRHAVKHMGQQLFPCTICQRKFDTPCYLKNHVRRVHRGSTVEVMNFQYPGTSLPKHLRRRTQGGRPSNRLQSEMKNDNKQIEITMTTVATPDISDLTGHEAAVVGESGGIYPVLDSAGMKQEITAFAAQSAPGAEEHDVSSLDLSGLELVQIDEDGGTKVFYVPDRVQYIEIGDNTINLESAQFP